MKAPTNQTAAILQRLIRNDYVTEQEMCMNGFRARISELKQLITIETEKASFVNQFGHSSYFNKHSLTPENKIIAKEIYEKINK